jgi:hypothetical protein
MKRAALEDGPFKSDRQAKPQAATLSASLAFS